MGRGNCCVHGEYEGLFYVYNDDLWVYHHKDDPEDTRLLKDVPYGQMDKEWLYDEEGSMMEDENFRECFIEDMTKRFPSFERCDKWVGYMHELHAIMESKMFYICIEDNEGSLAVELIQKDDDRLKGLQSGLYQKYLDGIKKCLFNQFETLGVYRGAWTHGTIKREGA